MPSFFLSSDEAKTLGNIDYMRTPKTVRRTFPKTMSNKVGEQIEVISALDKNKAYSADMVPASAPTSNTASTSTSALTSTYSSNPTFNSTPKPEPKSEPKKPAQTTQTSTNKRRGGDSLDMFRQMARTIKKY